MSFDVAVVGDINLDLIMAGVHERPGMGKEVIAADRALILGGSATNFACACARLGLRTCILGKVGGDEFGRLALEALRETGVCTDAVCVAADELTGITVAFSGADRGFITHLGTLGTVSVQDLDLGFLNQARLVHVGGYFLTDKLRPSVPQILAEARAAGAVTSLDTGWDPQDEWEGLDEAFEHLDILLVSETEIERITSESDPEAGLRKSASAVGLPVAKLGPDGAMALDGGGIVRADGFAVSVVDTTAAGDCFNAGFVYGRLSGEDMATSLRYGNAAGALCVGRMGGGQNVPTLDEVQALLVGGGQ